MCTCKTNGKVARHMFDTFMLDKETQKKRTAQDQTLERPSTLDLHPATFTDTQTDQAWNATICKAGIFELDHHV